MKMGRTTYKLAINWQNFAQVGLQLKFAFRIRPKINLVCFLLFFFAQPHVLIKSESLHFPKQ